MISITIAYKPLGFLWERRLEAMMPSSWSELNAKQIEAIPDLQRGRISEKRLLEIFLGVKRSISVRIDAYQRFCIMRHLQFIKSTEALNYFVIKNIMGFKAPERKLKGVTFGAFVFGDTYFQNYLEGNLNDLNRFIACYYLDKDGFDEKFIESRSAIIKVTEPGIREAIALNYSMIRKWLKVCYPYIFQEVETGKAPVKSKGMLGVFNAVVGNDIINQDKYASLPLHTVLRYLNDRTKEFYKNGGKV